MAAPGGEALLRALATPLPLAPPPRIWWVWLIAAVFGLLLAFLTAFLLASDLVGAAQGQVLRDTAVHLGIGELEARRPQLETTCTQEGPDDHLCVLQMAYTNPYGHPDTWSAMVRSPFPLPSGLELDLYRVEVDHNLPGLDLPRPTLGERWRLHLSRLEYQWFALAIFLFYVPVLMAIGMAGPRRRRRILMEAAGPGGRPVLVTLTRRRYRPAFRLGNTPIPEKIVWHYEWTDVFGVRRRVKERVQHDPLRIGADGMTAVALATPKGATVLVEADLRQFSLPAERYHAILAAWPQGAPGRPVPRWEAER